MLTNKDFLDTKIDKANVNPLGRNIISSLNNDLNRRYILCDNDKIR